MPPITVSVGIAMFGPDLLADLESLEEEADAALYEAKRAGRDALRVAGESAEPVGDSRGGGASA